MARQLDALTDYEPGSVTTSVGLARGGRGGGGGDGGGLNLGGFGPLLTQLASRRAWEQEQAAAERAEARKLAAEESAWQRKLAERELAMREMGMQPQRGMGGRSGSGGEAPRAIEAPRSLSLRESGRVEQRMTPQGELVDFVDPLNLQPWELQANMGGVYGSPSSRTNRSQYAGTGGGTSGTWIG